MTLMNNEQFLLELMNLFKQSKKEHSVYLTMKQYDGRKTPISKDGKQPTTSSNENRCLLRAKMAKKRISTVVMSKDLNRFTMAYTILLKNNMDGLSRKRMNTP
ncbi:hypothetical protein SNEBB_008983 [Seison nebaliae]|nr:hypothetical protein SNEBB_008983 [Seison nebaliae]